MSYLFLFSSYFHKLEKIKNKIKYLSSVKFFEVNFKNRDYLIEKRILLRKNNGLQRLQIILPYNIINYCC